MYIDRIILNNFRVYKGVNEIQFDVSNDRNVTVITGSNGFGKTSLLTSLVWCLYGKLMQDVDERYKTEITAENGGYKPYCNRLMNRGALDEVGAHLSVLEQQLLEASEADKPAIEQQMHHLHVFSVTIRFKKIFIPAVPCESIEITRAYNVRTQNETLTVLIDGQPNELTKEVGSEIFINDFILRKEIAKFFFFDAEKIVELAEIRSIEERRKLGKAYGEVLGIKKYLDLKKDLENMRLRLSKKSATQTDREKLEKLSQQFTQNGKLLDHQHTILHEKENEFQLKRVASDRLQEQLIREGSSITVEEMKDFRKMKEHLQEEATRLKSRMKDMIELAPLAIAGMKIEAIREQIEGEQELKDIQNNDALLKRKATSLKRAISLSTIPLAESRKQQLFEIIENIMLPTGSHDRKPLLDFTDQQQNVFFSVYDNLQNAFSKNFKALTADIKKQQASLSIINRRLSDAESKENDPVIKAIRSDKNQLDAEIRKVENECIDIKAKIIAIQNEQNSIAGQISELNKKISIEDVDKAKDQVAERLIGELEEFISRLKVKKKHLLEERMLQELNMLMHKRKFVKRVEVIIDGDLIDIELYDNRDKRINKASLSKGEQQLYATALLKALVDESHIRFPVFIDSPLQKFDREHARNIIRDFYPNVSAQVILFPLLEKELNEEEFRLLYPRISDCYLIDHKGQYESGFVKVSREKLFDTYKKQTEYVHSN